MNKAILCILCIATIVSLVACKRNDAPPSAEPTLSATLSGGDPTATPPTIDHVRALSAPMNIDEMPAIEIYIPNPVPDRIASPTVIEGKEPPVFQLSWGAHRLYILDGTTLTECAIECDNSNVMLGNSRYDVIWTKTTLITEDQVSELIVIADEVAANGNDVSFYGGATESHYHTMLYKGITYKMYKGRALDVLFGRVTELIGYQEKDSNEIAINTNKTLLEDGTVKFAFVYDLFSDSQEQYLIEVANNSMAISLIKLDFSMFYAWYNAMLGHAKYEVIWTWDIELTETEKENLINAVEFAINDFRSIGNGVAGSMLYQGVTYGFSNEPGLAGLQQVFAEITGIKYAELTEDEMLAQWEAWKVEVDATTND